MPQMIQEMHPESVERAVPDAIHDTGASLLRAAKVGESYVFPKFISRNDAFLCNISIR